MINLLSIAQPAVDGHQKWTVQWFAWLRRIVAAINGNTSNVATLQALINSGFTGTITTAKLTTGGTNGSMTFTKGVLTSQTPAT